MTCNGVHKYPRFCWLAKASISGASQQCASTFTKLMFDEHPHAMNEDS